MDILSIAKEVVITECAGLQLLMENLDAGFVEAVEAIYQCKGKVIICGMGKSGHIAAKMAATFASTGTPSFFIHPAEAYHGDLGMIDKDDLVILISYSGETDEVLRIIPFLRAQNNVIIGISGNPTSTLAKNAQVMLNVHVDKEACPLALAPTTSTTATLVMGDALAVALIKKRDFRKENFANFHPGGSLGKRLLTTVVDYMQVEEMPFVSVGATMDHVVDAIHFRKLGLCIVGDAKNVSGIITDGDLRRAMKTYREHFFNMLPVDIMTKHPVFIHKEASLLDAQNIMRQRKIATLLVGSVNELEGVIQMYQINS